MTTFFNRLKDTKAIRTKSMSYENNIAKITLTDTTEQTEGTYTCRASNEAGSVETNCKLSIQGKFLFNQINLPISKEFISVSHFILEFENGPCKNYFETKSISGSVKKM